MNSFVLSSTAAWQGRPLRVVGPSYWQVDWDGFPSGELCCTLPEIAINQSVESPSGAAGLALQLSTLGFKPTLVTSLPEDEMGRRLKNLLDTAGLSYELITGFSTGTRQRLWSGSQLQAAWSTWANLSVDDSWKYIDSDDSVPVVWICDRNFPTPLSVEPWFCWSSGNFSRGLKGQHLYVSGDEALVFRDHEEHAKTEFSSFQTVVVNSQANAAITYPQYQPYSPVGLRSELAFVSGLIAGLSRDGSVSDAITIAQLVANASRDGQIQFPYWQQRLQSQPKLAARATFSQLMQNHRERGHKVVFTNGCFDLLHPGHVTYLQQARALGDILVVAVNDDASVQGLKGPTRPINSVEDRMAVLAGLSCIDYVIPFGEPTPEALIELARPDIYVKGGDYTPETLPEAPLVNRLGGEIQILPFVKNRSTTAIVKRIQGD
ncbi:MAG: D-glycero-beta-D-manno-heptose 1-phosphate adenylyltransferase [Cyanobacteria bacterium P01_H01_bin.15]